MRYLRSLSKKCVSALYKELSVQLCLNFFFLGTGCFVKCDSRVVVSQAEYARLVQLFPYQCYDENLSSFYYLS